MMTTRQTQHRFFRPPNNDSDGKHNGGNLGLDHPNDSFAFDGDDAMKDDELHMWFNIASRVFLSNLNVHLTTPAETIPNVPVALEPNMHKDVIAKPNVDEGIEEDGNCMDVDEVQQPACHIIHPR